MKNKRHIKTPLGAQIAVIELQIQELERQLDESRRHWWGKSVDQEAGLCRSISNLREIIHSIREADSNG
jgi:hypothetical protein